MDRTLVSYEYLGSRTYNIIGDKSLWQQYSKSAWDTRMGTIQLTIFADGIAPIQPLNVFQGQGLGLIVASERGETMTPVL